MIFRTALAASLFLLSASAQAAQPLPSFDLRIKDHRFTPDTLTVPAGQKVKLIVHNDDPSVEEFDSYDLDREVNINGGSKAEIFIGPLKAGRYEFMGEMHRKTAKGVVIAR